MKLVEAPKKQPVRIIQFSGGRGVNFKLCQLGLTPGAEVQLLRFAPLGGPVMIEVEGRSVAIGRGIAARISVELI